MNGVQPPVDRVVRRRSTGRRSSDRPAVVLAVAGLLGAAVWWITGPAVDVAGAPAPDGSSVVTPLLSARRAPAWLTAATGARNLRQALGPVVSDLPPSSCALLRSDGVDLLGIRAGLPVIPASNLKPLTAVAAVDLLGADTRLSTVVVGPPGADGSVGGASGVVDGDLVLVGGGDPVLSTAGYEPYEGIPRTLLTPLELLADRVAATGITRVSGSVLGDESRYDSVRDAPGWKQGYVDDGQVSPLSALVVDDSRTGPAGAPPAAVAAAALTRLLEERGIQVVGAPRVGVAPPGDVEVARVDSPTVAELAEELVRFSDNTTAELLVKEIGLQRRGTGSTAAGTDEVLSWARTRGLPVEDAVVVDGSGLSRNDRLSCAAMVGVLEEQGPDSPLAASLARPGTPGTLEDRMLGTGLVDRLRAKTGSLDGVRSLAGWLRTTGGRDVVFAVAANADDLGEQELERLEERVLVNSLDYPDVPPPDVLRPRPAAP